MNAISSAALAEKGGNRAANDAAADDDDMPAPFHRDIVAPNGLFANHRDPKMQKPRPQAADGAS